MLDHSKPYVEKIHHTDAELAGHAHKLDMKLQGSVGMGFLCACLPSFTTRSELTNNALRKQRWGSFLHPKF